LRRFEDITPAFTQRELERAISEKKRVDSKVTLKIDPKLLIQRQDDTTVKTIRESPREGQDN